MVRHTHTYAVLEVKRETFEDIKERLRRAGEEYLARYLMRDGRGREVIVLGEIGIRPEGG